MVSDVSGVMGHAGPMAHLASTARSVPFRAVRGNILIESDNLLQRYQISGAFDSLQGSIYRNTR